MSKQTDGLCGIYTEWNDETSYASQSCSLESLPPNSSWHSVPFNEFVAATSVLHFAQDRLREKKKKKKVHLVWQLNFSFTVCSSHTSSGPLTEVPDHHSNKGLAWSTFLLLVSVLSHWPATAAPLAWTLTLEQCCPSLWGARISRGLGLAVSGRGRTTHETHCIRHVEESHRCCHHHFLRTPDGGRSTSLLLEPGVKKPSLSKVSVTRPTSGSRNRQMVVSRMVWFLYSWEQDFLRVLTQSAR